MKFVTRLVLATTSLTVALTALNIKEASAALISYDFRVVSPSLTGNGRFTYDDTTFNSDAIPFAPVQSLTFRFDGQSVVYNQTNDVGYPDFPIVFPTTYLTGKNTIGLGYTFNDLISNLGYEISGLDFTAFSRTNPSTLTSVFGTVSYTRVPEPATLVAGFVTCGAAWFMKKRGTLTKKV